MLSNVGAEHLGDHFYNGLIIFYQPIVSQFGGGFARHLSEHDADKLRTLELTRQGCCLEFCSQRRILGTRFT